MTIRLAKPSDLAQLQEIERASGSLFAAIGMQQIADDEPTSIEELRRYQAKGRVWVYVDASDTAVAYLIADLLDQAAHIEQVSVHPSHAGRCLGRALIDHVAARGQDQGVPALTLTTFTDVAEYGPHHERCGFRFLAEHELTAALTKVRALEKEQGLDQWPRSCMRRETSDRTPTAL